MVGPTELESVTSCVSSRRSNQLSYEPFMWTSLDFKTLQTFIKMPRLRNRANRGKSRINSASDQLPAQLRTGGPEIVDSEISARRGCR